MRMRSQSQIRSLVEPPPVSGDGGCEHLSGSEGVTTRARWARRCLADPLLPCTGSGRPRKRSTLGMWPCPGGPQPNIAPHKLRRRSTDGARSTGDPEVTKWRDWANLTTVFIEDIAGRLLSLDVSEYLRFRAVCKPWRMLTDDPRARGLDSQFRARKWFPQRKRPEAPSHCLLRNNITRVRILVNHQVFSTSQLLSVVDGLLVLCNKATNAVCLLNPLTGTLAEFPVITDVRDRIGEGPNARLDMDVFKSRFPGLGGQLPYIPTDSFEVGFPAFNAVLTSAGIDDSTSPPTLQLCVRDESWMIIRSRPGDEYWIALYPNESFNDRLAMQCYTYRYAGASPPDCSAKLRSPSSGP